MLHSPKTSDAETPPRKAVRALAAISDGRQAPGAGIQRFHDTSPKDGASNT